MISQFECINKPAGGIGVLSGLVLVINNSHLSQWICLTSLADTLQLLVLKMADESKYVL